MFIHIYYQVIVMKKYVVHYIYGEEKIDDIFVRVLKKEIEEYYQKLNFDLLEINSDYFKIDFNSEK